MKKILKNKDGITLVALVITIIVMLILVTVTLNVALNDNGIISKAKYARTKQEEESIYEQILGSEIYGRNGVDLVETKDALTALGYTCGDISNESFLVTVEGDYGRTVLLHYIWWICR